MTILIRTVPPSSDADASTTVPGSIPVDGNEGTLRSGTTACVGASASAKSTVVVSPARNVTRLVAGTTRPSTATSARSTYEYARPGSSGGVWIVRVVPVARIGASLANSLASGGSLTTM